MNELIKEKVYNLTNGTAYIYRSTRTGNVIAAVSEHGQAVTKRGLMDDLSDDELLELLRKVSLRQNSK